MHYSRNHSGLRKKLADKLQKDQYSQMEYSSALVLTILGIFCISRDFPAMSLSVLVIMSVVMFLVLRTSIIWGWTNPMREDDIDNQQEKKSLSTSHSDSLNKHHNRSALTFSSEKEVMDLLQKELLDIKEKKVIEKEYE